MLIIMMLLALSVGTMASAAKAKHVHRYAWTTTKKPTCSSTGSKIRKCSCGRTSGKAQVIPKDTSFKGHSLKNNEWKVTNSCGTISHSYKTCKLCKKAVEVASSYSYTKSDKYKCVPKYSVWVKDPDATCSRAGTKRNTCKICGLRMNRNLPADPSKHTFTYNSKRNAYVCSTCSVAYTKEAYNTWRNTYKK